VPMKKVGSHAKPRKEQTSSSKEKGTRENVKKLRQMALNKRQFVKIPSAQEKKKGFVRYRTTLARKKRNCVRFQGPEKDPKKKRGGPSLCTDKKKKSSKWRRGEVSLFSPEGGGGKRELLLPVEKDVGSHPQQEEIKQEGEWAIQTLIGDPKIPHRQGKPP